MATLEVDRIEIEGTKRSDLTVTERIAQTAVWLLVLGLLIGILLGIRWLTTIASRMVTPDCAGQEPATQCCH